MSNRFNKKEDADKDFRHRDRVKFAQRGDEAALERRVFNIESGVTPVPGVEVGPTPDDGGGDPGGGGGDLTPGVDFPRYFQAEVLSADNASRSVTVEEFGVGTVFTDASNQTGKQLGPGLSVNCQELAGDVVALTVISSIGSGDGGVILPGEQLPVSGVLPAVGDSPDYTNLGSGYLYPALPNVVTYRADRTSTVPPSFVSLDTGPYDKNFWKSAVEVHNYDNFNEYTEYSFLSDIDGDSTSVSNISFDFSQSTGAVLAGCQGHEVASDALDDPVNHRSYVMLSGDSFYTTLPRVPFPGLPADTSSDYYKAQYFLGGIPSDPNPNVFVFVTPSLQTVDANGDANNHRIAALYSLDLTEDPALWAWSTIYKTSNLQVEIWARTSTYTENVLRYENGSKFGNYRTSIEFPLLALGYAYRIVSSRRLYWEDAFFVSYSGAVLRGSTTPESFSIENSYQYNTSASVITRDVIDTADPLNLALISNRLSTTAPNLVYRHLSATALSAEVGTELRLSLSGVEENRPDLDVTRNVPFLETEYEHYQESFNATWTSQSYIPIVLSFPDSYPDSANGHYRIWTVLLRNVVASGSVTPTDGFSYNGTEPRPGVYDFFVVVQRPDGFVSWTQVPSIRLVDKAGTPDISASASFRLTTVRGLITNVNDFFYGGPNVVQISLQAPYAYTTDGTDRSYQTGSWVRENDTYDDYVEISPGGINSYRREPAYRDQPINNIGPLVEIQLELYPTPEDFFT